MACNFSNMNTKKLKINIPEGYEIDKEKSTFEEIVFKKIEDPLAKLPKTWEEYCKQTEGYVSYFFSSPKSIIKSWFEGSYNEFITEERVKQYVALGRLLQLRDYWVKGYSEFRYAVYGDRLDGTAICDWRDNINHPLTFPTREMAQKFVECFKDLMKKAHPLI